MSYAIAPAKGGRVETGHGPSAVAYCDIPCNAAAHTKGTWTEVTPRAPIGISPAIPAGTRGLWHFTAAGLKNIGSVGGSATPQGGASISGHYMTHATTGQYTDLAATDSLVPTGQVTILFGYKKLDTTMRAPGSWGVSSWGGGLVGGHLLHQDGKTYFYFGGTLVQVASPAITPITDERSWGFTAGPRGTEIWYQEAVLANNPTPTPARSAYGTTFRLNWFSASSGDVCGFRWVFIHEQQLPTAMIAAIMNEPEETLFGPANTPGFATAVDGLTVCVGHLTNTSLLDIGIAPPGSDPYAPTVTPIIQNIQLTTRYETGVAARTLDFPVSLPAGTRVFARQQNDAGPTPVVRVAVIGRTRAARGTGASRITTYGANLATSRGTLVDTQVDVKSAWAEFTPGCLYPVRRLLFTGQNWTGDLYGAFRFDIGIGPAGSETVLLADVSGVHIGTHRTISTGVFWFDCNIPAGTRIAVRAITNDWNNWRQLSVILHCAG
jgi:hypothetical protein